MPISTLIDKYDTSEIVRDKIAAILLAESTSQQALAVVAGEDPKLWKLRVFTDRSNPWEEWLNLEVDDTSADLAPIVNITLNSIDYSGKVGDTVERQTASGSFWLDCYGVGFSSANGSGHIAGDALAAREASRCARLVRNILMSSIYTYLDLPRGTVGKRWITTSQMFQPDIDSQSRIKVVGSRISFSADFNEFSPQYVGSPLESIAIDVLRLETGEVYLTAEYGGEDVLAFATQHFSIGKIGAPVVAAAPGTPDPSALAVFSQINAGVAKTIEAVHLHGIEDLGSGSVTAEVYRRRAGTMLLLGSLTLAGGAGDFRTAALIPSTTDVLADDYFFAQLTSYQGAGGYDGITLDIHFE